LSSTDREGERIKLPNADNQPVAFWAEVERRQTSEPTTYPPSSIGDLIARYRRSNEFTRLSEGTRSNYEVTIRRFKAHIFQRDGAAQNPEINSIKKMRATSARLQRS
jgi:hypothetical protein